MYFISLPSFGGEGSGRGKGPAGKPLLVGHRVCAPLPKPLPAGGEREKPFVAVPRYALPPNAVCSRVEFSLSVTHALRTTLLQTPTATIRARQGFGPGAKGRRCPGGSPGGSRVKSLLLAGQAALLNGVRNAGRLLSIAPMTGAGCEKPAAINQRLRAQDDTARSVQRCQVLRRREPIEAAGIVRRVLVQEHDSPIRLRGIGANGLPGSPDSFRPGSGRSCPDRRKL